MNIRKNDQVIVLKGKDRGKTGKVEKVFPKDGLAVVNGVNICKKHLKSSQKNPHGGILDFNAPLKISNLMIICPRCNKATRIKKQIAANSKLRLCKKCQESLDSKLDNK
ncbi:MAG: 50S ribosomal protein L24 [Patescibacteria group bacterium]|nr:50S ribosomal protein L24 [Patescibacteria group bacterium]